ncbi:hypothetical protein [Kitasatospora sp. MBT66]|uniref:hypothetical protein n=1 Tax=Kitasatospora sp. MBT66 TaxID=1444769 RepID=UPI00068B3B75|nr:hypothetical protein [Kitasatospora sp. MBT66]
MTGHTRPAQPEYRPPTEATVKQLYATAFRCGKPECPRPLYRMNNETGETILNSRIAHIHARRQGGPRWDQQMPEADNRSAGNLLPLCLEHAAEVDETPAHYPADLLREWKREQLREYDTIQRAWPITDDQAAEAVERSFGPQQEATATAAAAAVAHVARCASRLVETSRQQRRSAADAAAAWQAMRARWAQRLGPFFAPDTGDRLTPDEAQVEPPRRDTEECESALRSTLRAAKEATEPVATDLVAELGAVRVVSRALGPWCDQVEHEVRALVGAAAKWDRSDSGDSAWSQAVARLETAVQALGAAWHEEEACSQPPQPTVRQSEATACPPAA